MVAVARGLRTLTVLRARPMESRKLMADAACMTKVASANAMAADTAATWCAKYELGDVLIDVPYRVPTGQTHAQFRCNNNSLQNAL